MKLGIRGSGRPHMYPPDDFPTENTDEKVPEPILDELGIHMFVDVDHVNDKVNGRLITGLFSVVG